MRHNLGLGNHELQYKLIRKSTVLAYICAFFRHCGLEMGKQQTEEQQNKEKSELDLLLATCDCRSSHTHNLTLEANLRSFGILPQKYLNLQREKRRNTKEVLLQVCIYFQ